MMFDVLDMGASGLTAQRIRMNTIACNIANANTTRNAAGKPDPYRRKFAVFAAGQPDDPSKPGVHVQQIAEDFQDEMRQVYDPGNPDADKNGNVLMPNVDTAIETVNMMDASRNYEADVTMMDVSKSMINASLRLIA